MREAEESFDPVVNEQSFTEVKEEAAVAAEVVEEVREQEIPKEQIQSAIVSPIKKALTIETENLDENEKKTYQIKLMSSLLKNQNTP